MPGFVRSLTARDRVDVEALIRQHPVGHCYPASRWQASGGDPTRIGCEAWGYEVDGTIRSALLLGANIVPIGTDTPARAAFADRLRLTGRRGSSMVGFAPEVLDLWRLLEPSWGPAREVRDDQPLMAIEHAPLVPPDDRVRLVRPDEIEILLPACIAMFTEEVGISPTSGGAKAAYRARIVELIDQQRALAWIEHGEVIFKAEIGAVSTDACQVQGVWVTPSRRGRGLSAPGMAAVVAYARAEIAPIVSLYVNHFNVAARRSYESVGFSEVGTFATVLF